MSRIRSTKKYAALIAVGLTDAQALSALGAAPAVDERLAGLLAAGFSQADAEKVLAAQFATPTAIGVSLVKEAPAKVTSKDKADALVSQGGYAHGKGRVYLTGPILEAGARVLKGGDPEIVQSSGVGRTKAVVLFREDSGDVACQNLYTPV